MQMQTDQIKRENIATIANCPTQYRPTKDLLMITPLPDVTAVGAIILPNSSHRTMNEGHIIAVGPNVTDHLKVGDCVTWDEHSEYRMTIDDCKFILVSESNVVMSISSEELRASAAVPKKNTEETILPFRNH